MRTGLTIPMSMRIRFDGQTLMVRLLPQKKAGPNCRCKKIVVKTISAKGIQCYGKVGVESLQLFIPSGMVCSWSSTLTKA